MYRFQSLMNGLFGIICWHHNAKYQLFIFCAQVDLIHLYLLCLCLKGYCQTITYYHHLVKPQDPFTGFFVSCINTDGAIIIDWVCRIPSQESFLFYIFTFIQIRFRAALLAPPDVPYKQYIAVNEINPHASFIRNTYPNMGRV